MHLTRIHDGTRRYRIKPRLKRTKLRYQQRSKRFHTRKLLQNLQQIGKVPVPPIFIRRRILIRKHGKNGEETLIYKLVYRSKKRQFSLILFVSCDGSKMLQEIGGRGCRYIQKTSEQFSDRTRW